MSASEEKGIIARSYSDGFPIIWKLVDEFPTKETMEQLQWLVVISWEYDGSENNGMPIEKENERMIAFEGAIEDYLEKTNFCVHANSRTGKNLKEFVYYIHDQDAFMAKFNEALNGHPRYPIGINFYHDPQWSEFHKLHSDIVNK